MNSSIKRISNSNDLSLHEALKNSYSKNSKENMKGLLQVGFTYYVACLNS